MTFTTGDSITPLEVLLSQAVDEGTAYTDTQLAVVNWTTFTPTASTTATTGTCRYRKFGPIVELQLRSTYTGPTRTASSSGLFTTMELFTGVGFPAGILPSDEQALRIKNDNGTFYGGRLYADGQTQILDGHPTATVTNPTLLRIKAIYMVG